MTSWQQATLREAAMPVSYTHLSGLMLEIGVDYPEVEVEVIPGAVSYTHLDVYKRQKQG